MFTPKSLLRHPRCASSLEELATGGFEPVLDDAGVGPRARAARRALRRARSTTTCCRRARTRGQDDVALVRLERLYPFPARRARGDARALRARAELVWCQEEPRNMGAWRFVRERFLDGDVRASGRLPRYVGRADSASPASGRLKVHLAEQQALVRDALRLAATATAHR